MRRILGVLAIVLAGCASGDDPYSQEDGTSPGVPYWSSGSTSNEGKSTHLWIVNHAVTVLGKHQDLPRAARAYSRMMNATCSSRWRQGLDDADHKVSYNNWFTWTSHFYDPSTGTNYLGFRDPVAYDKALEHLATARSRIAANDLNRGCYELGLALHYATDLTQPMHAANFAATDRPLKLHSNLEDYATEIQDRYTSADWTGAPSGSASAVLSATAWAAYNQWPGMWGALATSYDARCDDIEDQWFDNTDCWNNDAGVDAAIGNALRQSQVATAAFIYAADVP